MRWMLILVMILTTCWAAEVSMTMAAPSAAKSDAGRRESSASQDQAYQARMLLRKVQKLLRSDTSIARYTMRIETPEWSRSIEFMAWDDRPRKRFFIRILKPKKDRDTTWLKDGHNLWMYLPKLERDIRIPPSMMLSSWMGSDFTNDDLVKMESVVEDYSHRILRKTDAEIVIESLPKPDAAVVWGKIVHTIRPDGIPLADDFYDEHGRHVRRLVFDRVREMGGRRLPTRWIMRSLGEPGKRTVMILQDVAFDVPLDAGIFSRANLRRRTR